MASDIYVHDLRGDSDSSLSIVPRLTTWEGVVQYFKLRHLALHGWDATPDGKLCWKLAGVYLRTGVAEYIPQVLGEDGLPYWNAPTNTGALVVRTWPGAPDFPVSDPIRPDYNQALGFAAHTGVAGWTNQNGDAGFPYGAGSVTGANGGPDAIWVHAAPVASAGPQYSDCVGGLGWIGGTDHLTANPIFQLVRKPGTTPPPIGDEYLVYLNADGSVRSHVALIPGLPAPGTEALGVWRSGQVAGHVAVTAGAPPGSGVLGALAQRLRRIV